MKYFAIKVLAVIITTSSVVSAQETDLDFLQRALDEAKGFVQTQCPDLIKKAPGSESFAATKACEARQAFTQYGPVLRNVDPHTYEMFARAFKRIVTERHYVSYNYMNNVIQALVAERFTHQSQSLLSEENIVNTFSKFYNSHFTVDKYGLDTNERLVRISEILFFYADNVAKGEKATDLTFENSARQWAERFKVRDIDQFIKDSEGHRYFSMNSGTSPGATEQGSPQRTN